ncbi:MAG: hypothetical protein ACE5JJ_07335 [Nitrospinota bacterium]
MASGITAVEIVAALFAVFALVKLVVVVASKKTWYNNVARPIYGNPSVSAVVFVILAIIILVLLLRELTIAQIFASIALASLLVGLAFLQYSKELTPLLERAYGEKFSAWEWLYIAIWLILSLWVLYEVFIV